MVKGCGKNKYCYLEETYAHLRNSGYSTNETLDWINHTGIMSPNKQQLRPGIRLSEVKEVLREAKKEVKIR